MRKIKNELIKVQIIPTSKGQVRLNVWFRNEAGKTGVLGSATMDKEQISAKLDWFVHELDLSLYPADNPQSSTAGGQF